MEEGSGAENAKGVKGIRIDEVFSSKKQMRFLFDYGDEWEFILTCNGIVEPEPESNIPVPQAARVTLRSNIRLKKNNNMDDAAGSELCPLACLRRETYNHELIYI